MKTSYILPTSSTTIEFYVPFCVTINLIIHSTWVGMLASVRCSSYCCCFYILLFYFKVNHSCFSFSINGIRETLFLTTFYAIYACLNETLFTKDRWMCVSIGDAFAGSGSQNSRLSFIARDNFVVIFLFIVQYFPFDHIFISRKKPHLTKRKDIERDTLDKEQRKTTNFNGICV